MKNPTKPIKEGPLSFVLRKSLFDSVLHSMAAGATPLWSVRFQHDIPNLTGIKTLYSSMHFNYGLTVYTVCTDVEDLVSYVSQFMELNAGDLILTGTPAGTGAAM